MSLVHKTEYLLRTDQGTHPRNEAIDSNGGLLNRASTTLNAVIFVALLTLTVVIAIPYGSVDAWWGAILECSIFMLTALWLLEVLCRGRWQIKGLMILLPVIAITIYAFLQGVEWPASWLTVGSGVSARHTLTIDKYQTFLTARRLLALTLFLGLLLLHTSTVTRLRWLMRVLIAVGLASAIFGILRQLLQSPNSPSGFVLPFLYAGSGYGQFLSANVFAYLMEMTFALITGLILGGGIHRRHVLIYSPIAIVVWTALVLSNSRGGIFSFICGSVFLLFIASIWYSARRLAQSDERDHRILSFVRSSILVRILGILLIVGTLISGVLWMGGDQLARKSALSEQESADGTTRSEIWRSTWGLIKDHPWTGVGFGAYFLAIPQYQSGSGRIKVEQAHNDYLDLAANGGLVACVLGAWLIGGIIWRARLSMGSTDRFRAAAALGAVAGVLSVSVHSLVDFGLQVPGIALVFAGLIVVAVADFPDSKKV
jgi:O-antigen ligase